MRFDKQTYLQIREHAKTGSLVVFPTGCTEQQGPHLPVDHDTWAVENKCLAAAQRLTEKYGISALVLPSLPFGPTPEHRNYGWGYIDLPQQLHEQVVAAVLQSLKEQGFSRIILWRGCGQHQLAAVVEQFNQQHAGQARAFEPQLPYSAIWRRIGDPNVSGGHADSFTTSLRLYLDPEAVRQDQIADPQSKPVDWDDENLDFTEYSSTGVIGDPTLASSQLGEKLWNAVVEEMAETFREIAESSL